MFIVVEILYIESNVSNPALATSCLIYRFLQTGTVIEMYEITICRELFIMEEKAGDRSDDLLMDLIGILIGFL